MILGFVENFLLDETAKLGRMLEITQPVKIFSSCLMQLSVMNCGVSHNELFFQLIVEFSNNFHQSNDCLMDPLLAQTFMIGGFSVWLLF